MFKIITSCVCAAAIVFGSVTYDPFGTWLLQYEKKFEWVAESTIDLITGFEGYRTKAYQDQKGNWTIGVGHLIRSQDRYMLHRELSDTEVRGLLHRDLEKCSEALKTALNVPVTRTQSDALHSPCHNIGPDRMVSSNVIKHMNNNQPQKAADAFMEWTKPAVLKRRRQAERAVFLAEI